MTLSFFVYLELGLSIETSIIFQPLREPRWTANALRETALDVALPIGNGLHEVERDNRLCQKSSSSWQCLRGGPFLPRHHDNFDRWPAITDNRGQPKSIHGPGHIDIGDDQIDLLVGENFYGGVCIRNCG